MNERMHEFIHSYLEGINYEFSIELAVFQVRAREFEVFWKQLSTWV